MIEAKAKLKNLRMSAKKVRLVADSIRGAEVNVALDRLQVLHKKSSPIIAKLIKSAVANANDRYDVKQEDLLVKTIIVNKGMDLKRWRPAAFGRAHPFRKHSCHIELVLDTKEGIKVVAKEKKTEDIETVDLTKIDNPSTPKATKDRKSLRSRMGVSSKSAPTSGALAKGVKKDKGKVKTG